MEKVELQDRTQEIESLKKEISELEKEMEKLDKIIAERTAKNEQDKKNLEAKKSSLSKLDYYSEKADTIDTDIFEIKYKRLQLMGLLSSKKQILKIDEDMQRCYEIDHQPSQE